MGMATSIVGTLDTTTHGGARLLIIYISSAAHITGEGWPPRLEPPLPEFRRVEPPDLRHRHERDGWTLTQDQRRGRLVDRRPRRRCQW